MLIIFSKIIIKERGIKLGTQSYIIFNDINSLDIKGIVISALPTPDTPARRITKVQVPGRPGDLRIIQQDDFGRDVYDSIDKDVKLAYFGNQLNVVKSWLRGTGKLILSNQPDRYFKANIDNIIPLEKLMLTMYNFTITFSCFPYAYLLDGDRPIVYTPTSSGAWETILSNNYDIALPDIEIYGYGDIGVLINGIETDFYSVDEYIKCSSELQQCFKGSQNLGMNMAGPFPALMPGKNSIEFTGNIQKVIITPHWGTIL